MSPRERESGNTDNECLSPTIEDTDCMVPTHDPWSSSSSPSALREPLLSNENDNEPPVSRNVKLTLLYTAIVFAGRSIWSQSVLSAFVYLLKGNDPEAVGYITAVMGIAQMVFSVPSGFVADRYRRDTLLRFGSLIGVMAIAVTLAACWRGDFVALVMALVVWGCFWGVNNTALSALFADSVRPGQRSLYFTRRSIIINFGNTTGPVVALIMFAALGNEWSPRDCAFVMAVGQVVCLPAIVMLCFFNDNHAVANEAAPADDHPLELLTDEEDGHAESWVDQDCISEEESVSFLCSLPQKRVIPVLIATADLLSGLGSGMSIRYFPIFFVDNLQLSPVLVQVIYMISPLVQALCTYTAQKTSTRFGRCHSAAYLKWIGISLMFSMILAYKAGAPTWIVCLLYCLRTGTMNSTSALTRSVLMDNVPKEERAKWSALESVNMFSWSGSAALGGVLIGIFGILPLFACTAVIQFVATLPVVALFSKDKELMENAYNQTRRNGESSRNNNA